MEVFISTLQNYWGIILFALCFVIYLITQGRSKAKQIILSLMLRAEKEAEALLLKNEDQKFMFVVDYGYQLLPARVKLFITYKMFTEMANSLYASAKNYLTGLNKNKPKQEELQESKITDPG
ncbi:MAG TPA: hypothetical protein DEF42_03620 [Desulfosporosinus sp.]|nr:hypothetical protein [Desulfosporosinus sp.]